MEDSSEKLPRTSVTERIKRALGSLVDRLGAPMPIPIDTIGRLDLDQPELVKVLYKHPRMQQ